MSSAIKRWFICSLLLENIFWNCSKNLRRNSAYFSNTFSKLHLCFSTVQTNVLCSFLVNLLYNGDTRFVYTSAFKRVNYFWYVDRFWWFLIIDKSEAVTSFYFSLCWCMNFPYCLEIIHFSTPTSEYCSFLILVEYKKDSSLVFKLLLKI